MNHYRSTIVNKSDLVIQLNRIEIQIGRWLKLHSSFAHVESFSQDFLKIITLSLTILQLLQLYKQSNLIKRVLILKLFTP